MSTHGDEIFELQRTLYSSKNPTRRWLHQSRRAWIVSQLDARAGKVHRALEVGPGSGIYLPELAKRAEKVVASDVEDAYLLRLLPVVEQHDNVELVRDDITRSNLESGSFDIILCTEVIEHIADSSAALREIRRLLRADGVLILSTPQKYSPLEVCGRLAYLPGIVELVRRVYKEPVLDPGHINLLTRRQLDSQLRDAGLQVHHATLAGVYLPVVAELLGARGLRLEQALEPRLRSSPRLSWLLWTQMVVAGVTPA